MSKENVDLIIRATDKASKDIAKITKSLREFTEEQDDIASGAKTADTGLGKLGESFKRLNGAVDGLNLGGKVVNDMNKVGGATTELDRKTAELTAEYLKLDKAVKQNDATLATLTRKTKGAAAAEKSAKDALAQRTREQKKTNAALKEASAANAKAISDTKGFKSAIDTAKTSLAGATARQTKWIDSIRESGTVTKRQSAGLVAAVGSVKKYEGAIAGLTADLERSQRTQTETALVAAKTGLAYDRSTAALERQSGVTKKIVANHNLLKQSTQATAGQQRNLENSVKRTSGQLDKQATKLAKVTAEGRKQTTVTNSLSEAYRKLYGDSRRALSVTQRLRGQVLSLIAAYAGFYGVVNILGQVVGAYQTLEAAQARLNVVFRGDEGRVAEEMEFLRRTANRLGIDLGTLSNEYSKFSIATQDTALQGEKTKNIFLAVAEAAVVNRSTVSEMSGVFVALTQIVSKGAVQMEELRQQLGDRLPGAIKIMADGLGVTTAELVKMMEQGQVTAEALVPFAEELKRRFGPGLEDALVGVTVQIGRMKNAIFQALVAFGNQGFLESFSQLMNDITETLESADFEEFSSKLSRAFGVMTEAVGILVKNFDVLVLAISAFIGVKLTPFLFAAIAGFGGLRMKMLRVLVVVRTLTSATKVLTATMRTMLISTGIGAAIVAVSIAIGYWATNADTATEAMNAHRKIVDKVREAYDDATGDVVKWREAVEELTELEINLNLDRTRKSLDDATKDIDTTLRKLFGKFGSRTDIGVALSNLRKDFKDGVVQADELREKINEIFEGQTDPRLTGLFDKLFGKGDVEGQVQTVEKFAEAVTFLEKTLIALTGGLVEGQEALDSINGGMTEAADDGSEAFQSALEALNGALGDTQTELDKTLRNLRDLHNEVIDTSTDMYELADATELYNAKVAQAYEIAAGKLLGGFSDGIEAAKELIIGREGFEPEAYNDPRTDRAGNQIGQDIYRAGFGSDTITLSDGTIVAITQGMRVSVADANRDLNRRIGEFVDVIKGQIGTERFDELNAQQQASLTSIAYNYGSLPDRILEAVRSGTNEEIASSIRALGGDNGGVNRERRGIEAGLFTTTAGTEASITELERLAEIEEKRLDTIKEFNAELAASVEQTAFESSIVDEDVVTRETMLALREKELEAQELGEHLTEQQRLAIIRVTEEKFRQQLLDDQAEATRERAVEAEKRVNDLISQRSSLASQLEFAVAGGDQEQANELQMRIEAINAELLNAITNAQNMWEAVGGDDADVAIENLELARQVAADFGKTGEKVYADWSKVGDMFVNKLASAFDNWSKKIAEGASLWEATRSSFLQFAGDFLREIAQMIIKQAIFNALKAAFGGTAFGDLIGIPTNHSGGMAGTGAVRGGVSPAVFAGAMRFHEGGVPGLKTNELPIIVEKEEEILTRNDPRHVLNGGKSAGSTGGTPSGLDLKVVIPMSPAEILKAAVADRAGQDVVLEFMQDNSNEVNAALGTP